MSRPQKFARPLPAVRSQRVVAVDSRATRFDAIDSDGRPVRLTASKLIELRRILGPAGFRERFPALTTSLSWKRPPKRGAYVARIFCGDRPSFLWCEAEPRRSQKSLAVAHILHLPGGGLQYLPHGHEVPSGPGVRTDRVTKEALGTDIEATVARWLGRAAKCRGKAPEAASRAPLELLV